MLHGLTQSFRIVRMTGYSEVIDRDAGRGSLAPPYTTGASRQETPSQNLSFFRFRHRHLDQLHKLSACPFESTAFTPACSDSAQVDPTQVFEGFREEC